MSFAQVLLAHGKLKCKSFYFHLHSKPEVSIFNLEKWKCKLTGTGQVQQALRRVASDFRLQTIVHAGVGDILFSNYIREEFAN